MTFDAIAGQAAVPALGWALVHFLWQGALAAAALALADALVARRAASLRYALATSTLAVMVALPVLTFASLVTGAGITEVMSAAEPGTPSGQGAEKSALVGAGPGQGMVGRSIRESLAPALPMLVAAWALGVVVLSVRVIGGWTLAQRLSRSGRPTVIAGLEEALARLCGAMRISRPVRLLESARVEIPTVIGWLRPVILFPAATLVGLTPAQLEVVLAHELAHVRRLDYLVNLLQTAVETLLFYHPAVWWVSRRVRVEREHCCDDAAVAACGDALAYARALTDLEGLRVTGPGLAMAADGGSLLRRIGRLVGRPPAHARRASRALGGGLALLAVPALLAGSGWLDARAQARPEAPAKSEAQAPAEAPAPAPGPRERRHEPTEQPGPAAGALTIEQVLELARAGVTPEYLDEMAEAGYPSLSCQELVALRSHGVDPTFVRGMAEEGYSRLTPERLVELRSQGVGPEFARRLREQGLGKLSLSSLVELRSQGVGPEFVSEMKAVGYRDLSPSDLLTLRSHGVSGEYVRELKDLGYAGLSLPVLIGLRNQGVTPEYIRALKESGYDGLPAGLLIELRSQGVTPEFARELKQAGWGALSPQDLIELRSQGVGADLLRRLRRENRPQPRPEAR